MTIHDPYIVTLTWVDSCEPMDNAEIGMDELPHPQIIEQVGFLLRPLDPDKIKESDHVVVAGAFKPQLQVADYVISIPRSSILSITVLNNDLQA